MKYNGQMSVTSGQPHDNSPSFSQSGDTWTISFNCGRSGSDTVASNFISWSGGSASNLYCPTAALDSSPGDLNFTFGVSCAFQDGTVVDIYFAQGHAGVSNNWWMGSQAIQSTNKQATLKTDSYTYALSGGTSDFKLQ